MTDIPANAIVTSCAVQVLTQYSPGTTITVGQTGQTSLLMGTTDIYPTVAAEYEASQRTPWGSSALPVLATVSGSPSVGSAVVLLKYCSPVD